VAGTLVAMADGTSKAIEAVAVGDWVLGRDGANRVVSILRPILGKRPLYALDGGTPFVTAGHPFLTAGGWRAIDPDAAAIEVPGLEVGQLTVGDRLLALAGVAVLAGAGGWGSAHAEARFEPRPLSAIAAGSADPATPLYHLVVDGDHTYIAFDLVVHNKVR
jgi:hypothetical protein